MVRKKARRHWWFFNTGFTIGLWMRCPNGGSRCYNRHKCPHKLAARRPRKAP